MSAMPHAQHMERVLESLAAGAAPQSPGSVDVPPRWRLVSRDGSTSAVTQPAKPATHDCPDCLAGRCGQNPQGCKCGNAHSTISMTQLTDLKNTQISSAASQETAAGPAMPLAKPQLFEQPPKDTVHPVFMGGDLSKQKSFFVHTPPLDRRESKHSDTTSVTHDPGGDQSLPVSNSDPHSADDLQRVIERWPTLARSTRRAILLLVSTSNEADSA